MLAGNIVRRALGESVCVELVNGETYIGKIHKIDNWMNISLQQGTRTDATGANFQSFRDCLLRGGAIQSIQLASDSKASIETMNHRGKSGAQARRRKVGRRNSGRKKVEEGLLEEGRLEKERLEEGRLEEGRH